MARTTNPVSGKMKVSVATDADTRIGIVVPLVYISIGNRTRVPITTASSRLKSICFRFQAKYPDEGDNGQHETDDQDHTQFCHGVSEIYITIFTNKIKVITILCGVSIIEIIKSCFLLHKRLFLYLNITNIW